MKINKYTIGDVTVTIGDMVRLRVKNRDTIGRVTEVTNDYIELMISKHNINKFYTYLIVEIQEIEICED